MSTESSKDFIEYIDSNRETYKKELFDFLRIPSISSKPSYKPHMEKAAQWLIDRFQSFGLTTELLDTGGNAAVFAQTAQTPGVPTVLVYGHYDVQPPEPLEEWQTPPFEPVEKEGNVYARGASDDKGQLLTHILAAQAWIKTAGRTPVNLKFLLEGDEESSGDFLDAFVRKNPGKLACDCVVISDSQMFAPGQPAIAYGLRGIIYSEVTYHGPNRDLHSGTYGGAVTNPATALCKALAGVHDERYKITIPGFYDDVRPISSEEQQRLAGLAINDAEFLNNLGVSDSVGEWGFTLTERRWARPCFDICGLVSGYTDEGAKTVLPSKATAKISCRLVPEQDPEKIKEQLKQYFQDACPPGITMTWQNYSSARAVCVDVKSGYVKAAAQTLEKVYGRSPEYIRDGGSIPIVLAFTEALNAPVLLLGWGLGSDNIHSPNEHFSLADFYRGIKASAYLLKQLANIEEA